MVGPVQERVLDGLPLGHVARGHLEPDDLACLVVDLLCERLEPDVVAVRVSDPVPGDRGGHPHVEDPVVVFGLGPLGVVRVEEIGRAGPDEGIRRVTEDGRRGRAHPLVPAVGGLGGDEVREVVGEEPVAGLGALAGSRGRENVPGAPPEPPVGHDQQRRGKPRRGGEAVERAWYRLPTPR